MKKNYQQIKNNRREKEILREINNFISLYGDPDSGIKEFFFTRVVVNPEERLANIYLFKLGATSDMAEALEKIIENYRTRIQQYINSKVRMKYPPKLKFLFDYEYLNYLKVNEIIDDLGDDEK